MHGPRHRRLLTVLFLLLSVGFVISGCRRETPENPYSPSGEYFEKLDSSGKRVLLVGPDDEERLKIRKRLSHYKVYDSDMRPLGRVNWEPSADLDERPRREDLSMRRLGDEQSTSVKQRDDAVYELPGSARLERTNRGWAIFSTDGEMLGSLEPSESGWRLVASYDDPEHLRVSRREGASVLLRGDEIVLRVEGGELPELVLLMQALTQLDPLERTLIGAWFVSREADSED